MTDLRTYVDRFPFSSAILVAWIGIAVATGLVQPEPDVLMRYGAARGFEVADGEPWRLFTYSFVHYGFLHLGMNSYAMFRLGPWAEGAFGPARFVAIYVLGAIGSCAVASFSYEPIQFLVGGSGAVFAIDGALVAFYARQGGTPQGHSALRFSRELLLMALASMLVAALIPGVSNIGHFGGLCFGLVVGWVLTPHPRTGRVALTAANCGFCALGLAVCLLAAFPVHRWEWHLFAWERATDASERAVRRDAVGRSLMHVPGLVTDADMRALAKQVAEARH